MKFCCRNDLQTKNHAYYFYNFLQLTIRGTVCCNISAHELLDFVTIKRVDSYNIRIILILNGIMNYILLYDRRFNADVFKRVLLKHAIICVFYDCGVG